MNARVDEVNLSLLVQNASFEMLPTEGIESEIKRVLPKDTTIHIMCPPERGADHSVRVCIDLANAGFTELVPHIASRTVRDRLHLKELLSRMSDAGIRYGFFPGGDGKVPYGEYTSAVQLLEDLAEIDHGLQRIGIGCYPEGHRVIPDDVLMEALFRKQRVATHMISEICLDPDKILSWLHQMRTAGIKLPLWVGVPGIIPLSRLLDACKEYGLRAALRFLKKSHGLLGAVFRGQFQPETVISGLAPHFNDPELKIANVHLYTFNEVAKTAQWRSNKLKS